MLSRIIIYFTINWLQLNSQHTIKTHMMVYFCNIVRASGVFEGRKHETPGRNIYSDKCHGALLSRPGKYICCSVVLKCLPVSKLQTQRARTTNIPTRMTKRETNAIISAPVFVVWADIFVVLSYWRVGDFLKPANTPVRYGKNEPLFGTVKTRQ